MPADRLSIYVAVAFLVLFSTDHTILTSTSTLAAEQQHQLSPLITTAELVAGENRFAFGLFRDGQPLEKASALVRLYALEGKDAHPAGAFNAQYRPVQNITGGGRVHRHADGTHHVHAPDSAVRGLYVSQIVFPRPGEWGIEILVKDKDGSSSAARTMVTVRDAPATPQVGTPAPKSRNLIAADVTDLREIDTSSPPDARLHQIRIADAIAQRKPQLIVLATPQFCTTRMCGPVVDIVRTLLPAYGERVAFIHQEIWQDYASKKPFATVVEWRLTTEPWIFIVDSEGIIRAKFEGLVTQQELRQALEQVIKQAS